MQPAEAEMADEHVRIRSASAVSLVPSEYSAFADVSLGGSSVSSLSSLPDQLCSRLCESLPVPNLQAAEISPQSTHCQTPQQVSSVLTVESDSVLDTRRRKCQTQKPKHRKSDHHPPAGTLMGTGIHCTSSLFRLGQMSSQQAVSESPVSVNESSISASPLSQITFGRNTHGPPTLLVTDALICPVSPSVFDIFTMLIRTAHFLSGVQNSVAPQLPLTSYCNPRNGEV